MKIFPTSIAQKNMQKTNSFFNSIFIRVFKNIGPLANQNYI